MTIIIEWKKNTSHFFKNFTLSDSVGDVMCPTGTEIVIFRHPMGNHFTPQKHTNFWKQREHILFGKSFILSDLVGDTVCLMGTEIDIFRTPAVCFFTQSGFPLSVFPKSRLPSCLICTRKIVIDNSGPTRACGYSPLVVRGLSCMRLACPVRDFILNAAAPWLTWQLSLMTQSGWLRDHHDIID